MKIVSLGCLVLLAGCTPHSPQSIPVSTPLSAIAAPEVVHTGRYTLVSIAPLDSQQFPLRQITAKDIPTPKKKQPALTRSDAMQAWLGNTGYSLCVPTTAESKNLLSGPLPEIQREMGPMRIEAALQVIAGSAWLMTVDEVSHTVCFQPSPALRTLS